MPGSRNEPGRTAATRSADRPCVIIGAGGHGRVVLDACRGTGARVRGFVDDGLEAGTTVVDLPVLGGGQMLRDEAFVNAHCFILGMGDLAARRDVASILDARATARGTAMHPSAVVAGDVLVGDGALLAAGAVVNVGARIGRDAILNTGCRVDHDCGIGENVHLAPGSVLCGTVSVGRDTLVGAGAVVTPGVRIGTGCVVGAGAVVVRDLPDGAVAYGNPARVRRRVGPE